MRIYMIRHGETDLNVKKCYYGVTEARLTEAGERQARALGTFFREKMWDRIYVSPLQRAWDTAVLVAPHQENSFIGEPALKEQHFGIFEEKTYAELCEEYPDELQEWNTDFSNYTIPGGESFAEVRARVEAWMKGLTEEEGEVLVVAHKGTLGHLFAAMLGLPLEGYWNFVFEQGCYSCVDLQDGYAIIRTLNQRVPE